MNQRRIAIGLLLLGATTGVGLAALGLLSSHPTLNDDVVARVNDVDLGREQFEQFVALINANSRTPKDGNFVLERMIDEELLVQRGVELGFITLNSTVRNTIVQAVTRRFSSGEGLTEPTDMELREFFGANQDYFTPPSQYHIELSGSAHITLPDKPLTEKSIIEYLGPTAANQIVDLDTGESTIITSASNEQQEVHMVNRTLGVVPEFDDAYNVIKSEYQRRQAQRAFDDYIAWLRERADIERTVDL